MSDNHIISDISKYGGLHEESISINSFATTKQLRALVLPLLNVVEYLLQLLLRYLRAILDIRVCQRIANYLIFGQLYCTFNELIINALLHECS